MAPPTLVVIGTSLGGLRALEAVLCGLPRGFPLPIVIVQHRGKAADAALAAVLRERTTLPVSEPMDKETLLPGHVYVAPADYHLLVDRDGLALSTDAPVCHARPSIDVLFESAAEARGSGVVGVVLTGSNEDGARGAARIKQRGGRVVVEDPATAESPIMPRAAAPSADAVLPLAQIAVWLAHLGGAGTEPS